MIEVYDYFDRPLLFSIRNATGSLFVISFATARGDEEKWMVVEISPSRLVSFHAGQLNVRGVFEFPENGQILLLRVPKSDGDMIVESMSSDNETIREFLAHPEVYINLDSETIEEANERVRSSLGSSARPFANLRLERQGGGRSTIDSRIMGSILIHWQDTVSNIGMNIAGMDNEKGRIPFEIHEATTFDYAAGWNGSVGVTLVTPERNRRIINPLLEQSLEVLRQLLESQSVLNYYQIGANDQVVSLSKRTLLKFKALLGSLRASESSFTMSYETQPGHTVITGLNLGQVYAKIEQIEGYADSDERLYATRGIIKVLNTTTGRMEIVENETDSRYIAYLDDREFFKTHSLSVPGEYVVFINESTSVNRNTGEEVKNYRVLDIQPIVKATE
ncbi:hypothetical protein E5F05_06845 [Deinococcus metallilatus]|uniref:DUF6575 domain-containing protein n=2 Tax=Deinococcus metallilatus TaxID=1211322 RepID=A0AAJ5JZ99_9DEIO|nr:DUF6575 domain-containing protein [Deinococcus metallilatus]MBB5294663.1 hypothetical protein [Deinococcus metallilatus]QBY07698.1 hypothetical protein E5F05_06845 [Deinococcus metallilatus]RXJ14114.1 hypothetical protein ERJ73_05680 [Deinococcus metallilatus]TLK30079.1 hypothetical protein FCS05_05995 [Deinococcus metallilatus]GMA15879.1 hypothetical protein GCM10025871_22100 [Deinococcus metallilatus]